MVMAGCRRLPWSSSTLSTGRVLASVAEDLATLCKATLTLAPQDVPDEDGVIRRPWQGLLATVAGALFLHELVVSLHGFAAVASHGCHRGVLGELQLLLAIEP